MKIFLSILIVIIIAIDVYAFQGVKTLINSGNQRLIIFGYLITSVLTLTGIAVFLFTFRKGIGSATLFSNILFGIAFSIVLTKLIFIVFLFVEDSYRIVRFIGEKLFSRGEVSMESRRKFISQAGLIVAAIPFTSLIYGVLKGKYQYTVHNVKLSFPDLPEEFDGFKIVQLSDIHAGSFDSKSAVLEGISKVIEQKSDLILFTGDMVNNFAGEVEPYLEVFGSLSAPFGKYSTLGNHDYGHYVSWPSEDALNNNLQQLKDYQQTMGFEMLNNRSVIISKEGASICLAGVENWGKPPFPQYGDLDKTFENVADDKFTILMSHDPSHWSEQVQQYKKHIHLTLSGHTHGMQMGIEIPGFKWSPVKYRYPNWAGLYGDNNKFLYVNRGFGFIGFPGRAGIWPEITVLELKKA
ncbi:MAG: metallophosphoesterase [Bacteroidales bacterium]|nr:metallophosphoesterase [Bacteroidales bacterium]